MPKASTTKRRGRPKKTDAEGGRKINKKSTQTITKQPPETTHTYKINHYHKPVYFNKEEETIIPPEDTTNHWTNNPYHENWLRYYHIHQQITLLEQKFVETVDWKLFYIYNNYLRVRRKLLVEGIVEHYETIEFLEQYYATNVVGQLKNYATPNVKTFFQKIIKDDDTLSSLSISAASSDSEYIDELRPIIKPSPTCSKN
jgi:hypothetical protein